jgi:hypothetical protein
VDPFHVTCETCHARLKIRSERVIGEIHACPKCESMVHIVPPPGWVSSTASAATADSSATTAVDASPAEAPASAASFSILFWGAGGAAVVLFAGLALVMWSRGDAPSVSPTAVRIAKADEAAVTTEAPVEPVVAPPVEDTVDSESDDAGDHPNDQPKLVDEPKTVPTEVAAETATERVAQAPEPRGVESDEEVTTVSAAEEPSEALAQVPAADEPVAERTPVLKFDPLDFDPSQLSLGGPAVPPDATSASAADASVDPIVVDVPDDSPPPPEGEESLDGDPAVTVRLGPEATDAVRPRDVHEQLALEVDSFAIPEMPLVKFTTIMSELGNVPITLDPTSLAMAGVSPRSSVSVRGQNTTLEQLLRDGLSKRRLDFVEREGQVVVVHRIRDERRTVDYDVADLLEAGAQDAADIAKTIERFIAPDTWNSGSDGGIMRVDGTKLHVEHSNLVQIAILIFCERLRMVRGLPQRSRYPADLLSIDSPYSKLSPTLSEPTTFTFLPWTRLTDVVAHWQASTGVTMLVNWEALAKEELAPGTPIACSAINRPWDAALDAVLEPLGLTWWAIDGQTIQITSRDKLASLGQIEFYAVPRPTREQYAGAAELLTALHQVVSEIDADVGVPSDAATRIELDRPTGRLMVLASPAVHRRLAERWNSPTNQ